MNKDLLLKRLNDICVAVSRKDGALALLALGSAGKDRARIDQYSDLDFFIICKQGYKSRFLENLDYLEDVSPIGYAFRNTVDGYKLLYKDGCFCEFAVFEPQDLENIPFSEGRIAWKAKDFDVRICQPNNLPKEKELDVEWTIGEALTNIYIGLGRYYRGEKLAAFTMIQCFARERIVDLMVHVYPAQEGSRDLFAVERRFELRYPDASLALSQMIQGYDRVVESAQFMLEFLCQNFEINEVMKNAIIALLEQNVKAVKGCLLD